MEKIMPRERQREIIFFKKCPAVCLWMTDSAIQMHAKHRFLLIMCLQDTENFVPRERERERERERDCF
jgi:hypothetical protein